MKSESMKWIFLKPRRGGLFIADRDPLPVIFVFQKHGIAVGVLPMGAKDIASAKGIFLKPRRGDLFIARPGTNNFSFFSRAALHRQAISPRNVGSVAARSIAGAAAPPEHQNNGLRWPSAIKRTT